MKAICMKFKCSVWPEKTPPTLISILDTIKARIIHFSSSNICIDMSRELFAVDYCKVYKHSNIKIAGYMSPFSFRNNDIITSGSYLNISFINKFDILICHFIVVWQ